MREERNRHFKTYPKVKEGEKREMTYLRVMSERVMIRGIEGPLKRLMDKVSWCLSVFREETRSYSNVVVVSSGGRTCSKTAWTLVVQNIG